MSDDRETTTAEFIHDVCGARCNLARVAWALHTLGINPDAPARTFGLIEVRLRDRDQIIALGEHVARQPWNPAPRESLTGVPIVCDADVPVGIIRLVYRSGITSDLRMT